MAEAVFVVASHSTAFRRYPERTHAELAAEAWRGLAALGADGASVERIYFGNCAMHLFGQSNIRGQVALGALTRSGELSATAPIINVEAGCATGGVAFQSAVEAVASGAADVALALGVEKTFLPEPAKILELFSHGIDQLEPDVWRTFYAANAGLAGREFSPSSTRIVFLDVAAMQASWHMQRYGTTERQLAVIASKNHANGAKNEKAQYRDVMSVEAVLADKLALQPLRRSMCAPISDGAAAVLVCGEGCLQALPASLAARAVRVASVASAGGRYRELHEESVTSRAAKLALERAGVKLAEVDLCEVHDATAFAELHAYEELGFCGVGEGGRFAESGATAFGGDRPVNLSGGLESKGHPLAATGLAMIAELHLQMNGGAGERQAAKARCGLFHNAGGQIGFDEAVAVVGILERR